MTLFSVSNVAVLSLVYFYKINGQRAEIEIKAYFLVIGCKESEDSFHSTLFEASNPNSCALLRVCHPAAFRSFTSRQESCGRERRLNASKFHELRKG